VKLVQNPKKIDELVMAQRKSGVLCEKLLSKIYHLHLKKGDTFIDVGARVGHHLFPMARVVGPKGKGLGIEANPAMAEGLIEKMKVLKFKNLEIAAVAAGKKKGKASFFIMEDYTGWSYLYEQHVHPNETKKPKKITVEIKTVDSLFSALKWKNCDFIKLDIENAEFPALMGASKTMAKYRPVVVFENSPVSAANLNDYSAADFFSFFEKLDYQILDIFLNPFTQKRWENDDRLPSYYVALPSESTLFESKETVRDYDDFLKDFLTNN
jgi:FkbM family methyltransferase